MKIIKIIKQRREILTGYCILAISLYSGITGLWLLIDPLHIGAATAIPRFMLWAIIGIATGTSLAAIYYIRCLYRLRKDIQEDYENTRQL